MTEQGSPPQPTAWEKHARWILVIGFVLTLSAGAVVGLAAANRTQSPAQGEPTTTPPARSHGDHMFDSLNLTADQQKELKAIWAQLASSDSSRDHRHELEKERDQGIRALLTPDQSHAYDALIQTYNKTLDDLSRKRHEQFVLAQEQTRAILDPDQRMKFDEIVKQRDATRDARADRRGRNNATPATQPAADNVH